MRVKRPVSIAVQRSLIMPSNGLHFNIIEDQTKIRVATCNKTFGQVLVNRLHLQVEAPFAGLRYTTKLLVSASRAGFTSSQGHIQDCDVQQNLLVNAGFTFRSSQSHLQDCDVQQNLEQTRISRVKSEHG